MMGKPVHTLSADDGKADASTLLGPKLTNEQIDQLADIFADRQVSALWQVKLLSREIQQCLLILLYGLPLMSALTDGSHHAGSYHASVFTMCSYRISRRHLHLQRQQSFLCGDFIDIHSACMCSLASGVQIAARFEAEAPAPASLGDYLLSLDILRQPQSCTNLSHLPCNGALAHRST